MFSHLSNPSPSPACPERRNAGEYQLRASMIGRLYLQLDLFCDHLDARSTSLMSLGRLLDVLSNTEKRRSPHEEEKRFKAWDCLYSNEKFSSEPLALLA